MLVCHWYGYVGSVEMFEGMFSGEDNNPFTILNELLKKENIEMKTELSMAQIKVLTQVKALEVLYAEKNKDKDPYELLPEIIQYYLSLLTSLNRERSKEIVRGLSEMKEGMFNPELVLGQESSRK